MKWTIKIVNSIDEKIEVEYQPLQDVLVFTGKYKAKNNVWTDFCVEQMNVESSEISLSDIQKILGKICGKLKQREEVYINLSEGFKYITDISKLDE